MLDYRNDTFALSPSSCAVIGLVWPSSTPSRPNIIVISVLRAFQNFSSSSCGVDMGLALLETVPVQPLSSAEVPIWLALKMDAKPGMAER
jgi:hypothetical protein